MVGYDSVLSRHRNLAGKSNHSNTQLTTAHLLEKMLGPVIDYNDGLLYSYTGHPSITAIMAHTQDFYLDDRSFAEYDAAPLADRARLIGAAYWLVATAEYGVTDGVAYRILQERQRQLLVAVAVVCRNRDGGVRLYDVRSLTSINGNVSVSAPAADRPSDVGRPIVRRMSGGLP